MTHQPTQINQSDPTVAIKLVVLLGSLLMFVIHWLVGGCVKDERTSQSQGGCVFSFIYTMNEMNQLLYSLVGLECKLF